MRLTAWRGSTGRAAPEPPSVTKPVTKAIVTKPVTKAFVTTTKGTGRPPVGAAAMTGAERKRRERQRKAAARDG